MKRKGNKTTNKEENKNKGDLKKKKQRRLEKKNSFFMILQEGEEKKQKKPQSSAFPPNKGEEHRAALSPHSLGVAQHQDDRVPPEEHLGDEPVPCDPRPPRARSLRRGPSCFRRVRPHLFDVLEDHVAVAVEGLECGGEGFVFFSERGEEEV